MYQLNHIQIYHYWYCTKKRLYRELVAIKTKSLTKEGSSFPNILSLTLVVLWPKALSNIDQTKFHNSFAVLQNIMCLQSGLKARQYGHFESEIKPIMFAIWKVISELCHNIHITHFSLKESEQDLILSHFLSLKSIRSLLLIFESSNFEKRRMR